MSKQCPTVGSVENDDWYEEEWWQADAASPGQESTGEPETEQQGEKELAGLFLNGIFKDIEKHTSISAVAHPSPQPLHIGVDSCAAVSVIPEGLSSRPVVQDDTSGTRYWAANKTPIWDRGRQDIIGTVGTPQQQHGVKFRVAAVSRPLLAVIDLVKHGKRVVFDLDDQGRNISVIHDKKTGKNIDMHIRNGTFEMDLLEAPPPPPGPFVRRGAPHP